MEDGINCTNLLIVLNSVSRYFFNPRNITEIDNIAKIK